MPPLSLLIKPASGNCNLRCSYCFYHDITENRDIPSYGMMPEETLEKLVEKALLYADDACCFAFQGGEPTLIGLNFFKKLIEFEKKYNVKKLNISNALQTNGMLINEEWAQFIAENNFLVGISLDGPKDIHDQNRFDAKKDGTFQRVMKTIDLFNKYKVEYNILFVVNAYVARHVEKIYNFFKKNHFKYLQFIPCLDPLNELQGGHKYSLTPKRFSEFLKTLFDCWYADIVKGNMISIRYFDNLVGIFMGYHPETCGMNGICSCQFVVEADGGVYPCDFYVVDEWRMGNLKEQSFEELRNAENANRFIDVSRHIAPECKTCRWFDICKGGCRRDREPFVDDKPGSNYFCTAYQEFLAYSIERLQHIARMLSMR